MKHQPSDEPSLFDEPEEDIIQTKVHPRWEYHSIPHMDFVAGESVVAFTYSLEALEGHSNYYALPVYIKLMEALSGLSNAKQKGLHNQAFTIFHGDIVQYGVFVIAANVKTAKLVNFLADYLRKVPGHLSVESANSNGLSPKYRFDNGYIIEYAEEELAGTYSVDASDNFGSGLTIYRRMCRCAEDIYSPRSIYGKLVNIP